MMPIPQTEGAAALVISHSGSSPLFSAQYFFENFLISLQEQNKSGPFFLLFFHNSKILCTCIAVDKVDNFLGN